MQVTINIERGDSVEIVVDECDNGRLVRRTTTKVSKRLMPDISALLAIRPLV